MGNYIRKQQNALPSRMWISSKNAMYTFIVRCKLSDHPVYVPFLITYEPHADIYKRLTEGRAIGGHSVTTI